MSKKKVNVKIERMSDTDSESEYDKKQKIVKGNKLKSIKIGNEVKIEPDMNGTSSKRTSKRRLLKAENKIETKTESNSDDSDYKPSKKKIKNIKTETERMIKPKKEPKSKFNIKQENEEQFESKEFKAAVGSSTDSYWQSYELLSEYQKIDLNVSQNIIKLFDEGCTIPFIARYRKDATDNMNPEILREVKQNYDKINVLKSRAQTVLNCIEKSGKLDESIRKSVLCARTVEEVEHIVSCLEYFTMLPHIL